MTENQIQAGSSVESLCKKCKTVTDHHVVAMLGDKIAKVECKVCRARHAYASPKAEPKAPAAARVKSAATGAVSTPAAAPRAASPKKTSAAASRQAQAQAEQWEKLVGPCASPVPYAMDRSFRTGDVINHPSFGSGYVVKAMKPCTIEVLFRDAVRNLRCGKIS